MGHPSREGMIFFYPLLGGKEETWPAFPGLVEDTLPLCAASAPVLSGVEGAGWVSSVRTAARTGTHPGPAGHPSREGMIFFYPLLGGKEETCPAFPGLVEDTLPLCAASAPVLSGVEGAGWVSSVRTAARTGTHPGPPGHPSREGIVFFYPLLGGDLLMPSPRIPGLCETVAPSPPEGSRHDNFTEARAGDDPSPLGRGFAKPKIRSGGCGPARLGEKGGLPPLGVRTASPQRKAGKGWPAWSPGP